MCQVQNSPWVTFNQVDERGERNLVRNRGLGISWETKPERSVLGISREVSECSDRFQYFLFVFFILLQDNFDLLYFGYILVGRHSRQLM